MISINSAIDKVIAHTVALPEAIIRLEDAVNCTLAHDVFSPIDLPNFDQSAMDGYAVCNAQSTYQVVKELKAGDDASDFQLKEGEAARIFTGGMTPQNAICVIKQESVETGTADEIKILEEATEGKNIRHKGNEIKKGELVLRKGTNLSAAAIGLLAGLGIEQVTVFRKPKIAILTTGSELTQPGNTLTPGKIYESNSATLRAILNQKGLSCSVHSITDDMELTLSKLDQLISSHDLILTTGGISVGDYDFVGDALTQLGVSQVFYKVNQKPGKPVFFGKKGNTCIFALPGNPAAVLTCFYVYVIPAINKMMGRKELNLGRGFGKLKDSFFKKGSREYLLKGKRNEQGEVEILLKQSSAMMSSFIEANCLVHLGDAEKQIQEGEFVQIITLP